MREEKFHIYLTDDEYSESNTITYPFEEQPDSTRQIYRRG